MTSEQPSLLVLAAGMGSRYGGLKQLEPIGPNGETLMDYSIYDARQAGFQRVVFLIRRELHADFESQIGSKYAGLMEVAYAYQEKKDLPEGFTCPPGREKPWGTGHAVWAARDELKNCSFGVINADDYYGAETFSELIDTFSKNPSGNKLSCAMVGFQLEQTLSEHGSVSRGICQTQDGLLSSVEEWTGISGRVSISGMNSLNQELPLEGKEIVSMNVWAFPSNVFGLLEQSFEKFLSSIEDSEKSEFYLPAAVDEWIKEEKAQVLVRSASCTWIGVTYQEDKPRVIESVAQLVTSGTYPSPLL